MLMSTRKFRLSREHIDSSDKEENEIALLQERLEQLFLREPNIRKSEHQRLVMDLRCQIAEKEMLLENLERQEDSHLFVPYKTVPMQQARELFDDGGCMFRASGVTDARIASKLNSEAQSQFIIKDLKKTIPERM